MLTRAAALTCNGVSCNEWTQLLPCRVWSVWHFCAQELLFQDPAGTTQVGLYAAVRQPLRIKADCAPGLKDDEALFLISQSSQAKINPSQTNQEPETISRHTFSQQAEALIPYLTAQHYLPYA